MDPFKLTAMGHSTVNTGRSAARSERNKTAMVAVTRADAWDYLDSDPSPVHLNQSEVNKWDSKSCQPLISEGEAGRWDLTLDCHKPTMMSDCVVYLDSEHRNISTPKVSPPSVDCKSGHLF